MRKGAMVLFAVIWLLPASAALAFEPLFDVRIDCRVGSDPQSVFACDLDEDGDKDLAAANNGSNNVSILKNNGDGTFQAAVNYITGSSPSSVFACDLDGDGDNDLAVANYGSNNVSILFNRTIRVGIEDEPTLLPTKYQLSQNFPNPFNAQTKIQYSLPG